MMEGEEMARPPMTVHSLQLHSGASNYSHLIQYFQTNGISPAYLVTEG